MCECFARVNEKFAEFNGALECNLMASPPRAMISVCKVNSRGKKPPLMEASYCPFCGRKYKNDRMTVRNVKAA